MRSFAEAARGVGAVGARGFETVVRGVRNRVSSAGTSERTVMPTARISQQTFRPGRHRQAAFAVGVAALLLLALVVVGVSALLDTEEVADQSQDVAVAPEESMIEETTAAPVSSEPAPPAAEAEKAVYDMYVQASYQDPNAVWPYFSQRFQEEAGSPEQWAERERLNTLWYVYFVQMPKAEVSGDTAKVRFQVRENRTGGSTLVSGTWVCVNEDGEWKLDRLEDERTQTLV
jgi:hypothetical protein